MGSSPETRLDPGWRRANLGLQAGEDVKADRCEYCSVRMDGLEVHSDNCPVRGPEIVGENEALKSENEILVQKVEALELQKDDVLQVLEKVARAARPDGYIGKDGQLLKEVERVLAEAHEEQK